MTSYMTSDIISTRTGVWTIFALTIEQTIFQHNLVFIWYVSIDSWNVWALHTFYSWFLLEHILMIFVSMVHICALGLTLKLTAYSLAMVYSINKSVLFIFGHICINSWLIRTIRSIIEFTLIDFFHILMTTIFMSSPCRLVWMLVLAVFPLTLPHSIN